MVHLHLDFICYKCSATGPQGRGSSRQGGCAFLLQALGNGRCRGLGVGLFGAKEEKRDSGSGGQINRN